MRVWEPLILDVLMAEVIPLSKMDMTNCLRIALDAACCLSFWSDIVVMIEVGCPRNNYYKMLQL